jgi:uncharacterized protein
MRYLGNRRSREFHDLERPLPQCQIDVIIAHGNDRTFAPDTLEQAIREGFEPCGHCIGTVASLILSLGGPVPSATDLEGEDLGDGRVAVRWTHASDVDSQQIRFDVYASDDPLQPLQQLHLEEHPGTSAELGGFDPGTDVYICVVARRGTLLALPSRVLRLTLRPRPFTVAAGPAAAHAGAIGLAFPFGVDPTGAVATQSGDPLLRSRVLQLLLTSPGERVNRPDYGTRLRDLVFDPNNDILAAATEFAVASALRRELGDELHVEGVQVSNAGEEIAVDLVYLRATDMRTERLRVGIPIPR